MHHEDRRRRVVCERRYEFKAGCLIYSISRSEQNPGGCFFLCGMVGAAAFSVMREIHTNERFSHHSATRASVTEGSALTGISASATER